jgi:hypothetical protein
MRLEVKSNPTAAAGAAGNQVDTSVAGVGSALQAAELSYLCPSAATSSKLTLTGAGSQQTAAFDADFVVVYVSVDSYVRQGANPTALNDGTDHFLIGGTQTRLAITRGNKLAIYASGAGTANFTPGA